MVHLLGRIIDVFIYSIRERYVVHIHILLDIEMVHFWNLGSFYSIAPTDNSSYILSGTGIIGTSYISALIAKTDSLGFPLWHKFYSIPGIPYWNNFPSITNTFDKGYIVCGYAEYNSTTKLRVIKTQPDPAIFTGVGALVNENNFTIRPNPSNGRFTVDAGRFDHVAVYNISGEKIYETSGSNPVIDLTGHLAGLYFVQSEGEDHEFIGKVILK